MMSADDPPYRGTIAVIATMHGKERVIGPVLAQGLGLKAVPAKGLDTDRFGTFSRDIARTGSQLDAARAKIAAAFASDPRAQVAVASEGSFGSHPNIPFLALGRELVVLIDRERGIEITGFFASPETNYGRAIVSDVASAIAFAERSRFPEHGLLVAGCLDEEPAPGFTAIKDIKGQVAFERAVGQVISSYGSAIVEADMRAHWNPTRMKAIERAASNLVHRFRSRCPACAHPGFVVTERVPGLPCEWCGEPTHAIRSEISTCRACACTREHPATTAATADPGLCGGCNP